MELIKNIFFNTDKLVENSVVKISYTGKFFQNNSEKVFIHYGFGSNWDGLKDVEMKKTELGFQAEIRLGKAKEDLQMCFKNNENQWDNNEGKNYQFEIEPISLALITQEQTAIEYPRKLRKSYLYAKKIKLFFYKLVKYVPRIFDLRAQDTKLETNNSEEQE